MTLESKNIMEKSKTHFWVLFLFETLLKLSINVIQISLVFHVINVLGETTSKGYEWLALFGVMLYSVPVIVGKFVDEAIGFDKSVKLGIFLLFIGSIGLFIHQQTIFLFGLTTISIGSSFFKPNLIVILDKIFPHKTTVRSKYFSYFYLSSNVGSLISTLLVGISAQFLGLKNTLLIAQMSLFILCSIFAVYQKNIFKDYFKKEIVNLGANLKKILEISLILSAIYLCLYYSLSEVILIIALLKIIKITWDYKRELSIKNSNVFKTEVFRIFLIILYAIIFFSLTSQIYYSFNLFLKHYVDRSITSTVEIPVAWFFSINPVLIITFGSVISRNIKQIDLTQRMVMSLSLLVFSYFFFYLSISLGQKNAFWGWIVLAFIMFVIAEIITIPHLISEITHNIAPKFKSRIVGVWYMTMAFAQYIASKIAFLICPSIKNAAFKDFSTPILKIIMVTALITVLMAIYRNKFKKLLLDQ